MRWVIGLFDWVRRDSKPETERRTGVWFTEVDADAGAKERGGGIGAGAGRGEVRVLPLVC